MAARIMNGVNLELEEEADRILARGRVGVTKLSEKKDYLSQGQLDRRRWREVYCKNGIPDVHLYSGLFKRAYNPNTNERRRGNNTSEY